MADQVIEQVFDPQVQPPEVEVASAEPEITVEVEGTPDADRPRMRDGARPEPEPQMTDEELAAQPDKIQKRIKHQTFVTHEAVRQMNEAHRERDAALNWARQVNALNQRLQQSAIQDRKLATTALTQHADSEMQRAQAALKDATANFDYDKVAEHTANIARLAGQRSVLASTPDPVEIPLPAVPEVQPAVSERATRWASSNPWFYRNAPMRQYAIAVHEQLLNNGVVADSEPYYAALDSEMQQRFPEAFKVQPVRKSSSPVAPVIRTNTAGKKVIRLSESQVKIARELGLSKEQYAQALIGEQDA